MQVGVQQESFWIRENPLTALLYMKVDIYHKTISIAFTTHYPLFSLPLSLSPSILGHTMNYSMHKSFHGGTEITQYLTKLLPKTEDYTWTTSFRVDVAHNIKVSSIPIFSNSH